MWLALYILKPQEKRLLMAVRRALLSLLMVLVTASFFAGVAAGSEGHRIVFLNLTMVNGVVRLDYVNIVPGKLKTPKVLMRVPGHILFSVLGEDQTLLYEGVVRDPSNIRYEYVDDNGQLKSKWVVSDSVSFSVRMPYQEGIQAARFSIIPGAQISTGSQPEAIRSLGDVEIDLGVDSDEE